MSIRAAKVAASALHSGVLALLFRAPAIDSRTQCRK